MIRRVVKVVAYSLGIFVVTIFSGSVIVILDKDLIRSADFDRSHAEFINFKSGL